MNSKTINVSYTINQTMTIKDDFYKTDNKVNNKNGQ